MTNASDMQFYLRDFERVDGSDNVAVALRALPVFFELHLSDFRIVLQSDIPAFHKFALGNIECGERVIRFGETIGQASRNIKAGEHVHSHNLSSALAGELQYDTITDDRALPSFTPSNRTFQGYRRLDGRVGTRNEIWIIPTVGCVSRTSEEIARQSRLFLGGRADDVIALPHPHGCSQLGDDMLSTRRVLAALASNPNVGGVVLVALGCETNQVDKLAEEITHLPADRVQIVRSQMTADEIESGLSAVKSLLDITANDVRSDCSVADLVIGLKCGGSDALSGLTANPLLGDMTDAVTGLGGKAILTEIPEIFGAEHLLMARTTSVACRQKIASLVNEFKAYFIRSGHPVNENPSPGNKDGGITTLEEKSLGAVQKAGRAPVVDVLRYGEQTTLPGLTLLEAPGNDAVSSTALAAAGATIILFTTGRGTPLGFPVPTLKISSNSDLAKRKPGWIDFDAGRVLHAQSRTEIAEELFSKIVSVATGERTCSERNGERAISIWKQGVTL